MYSRSDFRVHLKLRANILNNSQQCKDVHCIMGKRNSTAILFSTCQCVAISMETIYTPYSKMAADLFGYKLALVTSFKIKYSFEF